MKDRCLVRYLRKILKDKGNFGVRVVSFIEVRY